jgi:sarcosine oxidase subunit beta
MAPVQRKTADVAVIGGGIMGCSTALHLRLAGRSVVLLERGAVGSQASGVNFGNVRRQNRFLPQLPLSLRSSELWRRLPDLVGDDCEYAEKGNLLLAFSAGDMDTIEAYARGAREYGLDLELVSREHARSRWPWLTERVYGASFSSGDGAANPRLLTPAFARRARTLGAEICENAEVVSVQWNGARFVVSTRDGLEVQAECLVNTTGAWAGTIAAEFGEPVPLFASGPQLGVTEPAPYEIEPTVGVVGAPIYFRQVSRGNVVFGGGERGPAHTDIARAYVKPHITAGQLGKVTAIAPSLAPYHLIRVWSGIEGYLPDNLPVIGASTRQGGLFHAFGFCGHGFQLGPAVGAVLAELIVDGRSPTPIEPFSIARFAPVAAATSYPPAPSGAA